MSKPFITAVMPTYRRPKTLRRAIWSVLNQTYPDFRVCVYDNASGDETAAVVEEFRKKDSRVEYYCRPSNIGAFGNFVDGANRVETPYFSFLADDDLMLPHFFEEALSGFQRYPEAALSILPTLCMTPGGLLVLATNVHWPEGLLQPPSGMFFTLDRGNPGLQAMLIRKTVWDEFGGFDEATDPCGEYDLDLRVMARYPVVVSRNPGAIQVVHPDSITSGGGLEWVWPVTPRIISKLAENADLQPADRRAAIDRMTGSMMKLLRRLGVMKSISRGDWDKARRAADILVEQYPHSRYARTIRMANAVCRKTPGSPLLMRAYFGLRTGAKIVRNLHLQWEYRDFAAFLRTSTASAVAKSGAVISSRKLRSAANALS